MDQDEIVVFCYGDFAAQVRGKGFGIKDLEARLGRGVGWTPTNIAISAFGPIADSPFGPFGDLILMPDPSTKVRVDFGDGTAVEHFYLCSVLNTDGTTWDCCPRSFLARAVDDFARETGLHLMATFEQEFLYSGADVHTASAYNIGSIRRAGAFGGAFVRALRLADIDCDSFLGEFGPRQYEVTYRPVPAVRAADNALIVRELARATAYRLGHTVSFAPMTAPDGIGNGVHIHMSLWDENDRPVSFDPNGIRGMSTQSGHFIAGILRHLPALCALTAPSLVSYLRLTPHRWSATYNNLGYRDREAGVRIAPVFELPGADLAEQFNFEFRVADGCANPHLALGAILYAGLDGLRNSIPVPEPAEVDPETLSEAERRRRAMVRLPRTLGEALDLFEADRTVSGWLPRAMREAFVRAKRWEVETLGALDGAEQCRRYLAAY